jgi:hypothetical protein
MHDVNLISRQEPRQPENGRVNHPVLHVNGVYLYTTTSQVIDKWAVLCACDTDLKDVFVKPLNERKNMSLTASDTRIVNNFEDPDWTNH